MLNRLLTPDTVDFFIAGYAVFTLAIGIYLASLALRRKKAENAYRNLEREIDQG